jgi:hypothetical protein
MTERINTNAAEFISDVFHPTGDFSVQTDIPAPGKASIDVEGQVDNGSPWVVLGSLSAKSNPPIARFAKCPNVRLRLRNNDGTTLVKAWSAE